MSQLRDYQQKLKNDIFTAWKYSQNVLAVAPTGSGKTVLFCDIIQTANVPTCVIAHRQELVGQMSLQLAKYGVYHRIIGPPPLVKTLSQLHVYVLGKSFYDSHSDVGVAGINSLINRGEQLKRWLPRVGLWVLDEAHHLLKGNVWGQGVTMFPNARGLGVTATPRRADGFGLGRHHDGLFDVMVQGPCGRDLINLGYLSNYMVYAPPCDIDFSQVKISQTTGDYVKNQLVVATKRSHIIGDIVGEYFKLATGRLGVTFMPSVDLAKEVAENFNAVGIPAKMVSANTPDIERVKILRDFANRKILQLVNVDLFGEGFDLPALEVVSMGRKTESFALFCQQFGRVLRPAPGKDKAIIIDHVGNMIRHTLRNGLPDMPQRWTLDRRDRKHKEKDPDILPLRACVSCSAVYEAHLIQCPFCGFIWSPASRSTPEQVEGNLEELNIDVLLQLRGERDRIDSPAQYVKDRMLQAGMPEIAAFGAAKNHRMRQDKQEQLRNKIAIWAGIYHGVGKSDAEIYMRFHKRFKIDILKAQALGRVEAEKLTGGIVDEINRLQMVYNCPH